MHHQGKFRKIFSNFLRFFVSFVLLVILATKIDFNQTREVVASADLSYILFAFGVFIVINFVLLLRWLIFVRAMGLDVPFMMVMRYFFIGLFGNLFLPSAIGGDVIKIIGLCRLSDQKPKVVGSVLLDRLSGFASMVVVGTVSMVAGFRMLNDWGVAFAVVLMAAVSSLTGFVLFHERAYLFCCRIFEGFPRFKKGLMDIHYDIALLKNQRSAIYQAIGVSCLNQILLGIVFYFMARALHQDVVFIYFLIFVPLICVASSVPSIGGLGAREAITAFLFAKVNVETGVAVSIGLMNFVFMVAVGLVGGIVYLTTRDSLRVSKLSQPGG